MGCQLETVWAFGSWVDVNNQDAFAVFVASRRGAVFEPKRQVVGFSKLKTNILKATASNYASLEFVLRAETGMELKRRIMQLEDLGEYRGHVMFSYLTMTRLTPIVGRNGTWTDTHFTGAGARRGIKTLQGPVVGGVDPARSKLQPTSTHSGRRGALLLRISKVSQAAWQVRGFFAKESV